MNIDELKDLNLENLGVWPIQAKIIVIVVCCLVILVSGYYFDIQGQLGRLANVKHKEAELRMEFETKQNMAVNLNTYKVQLEEMQRSFAAMLRQLPGKTEVPGLLEDISKTGVANGLEFLLFKPLPERQRDFYIELPIQISVIGHYHQLAKFISQVASLDRIVSLHDFNISKQKGKKTKAITPDDAKDSDRLQMDILAKTYRYSFDNDQNQATQKAN